jgi:hypothetical protein
MQREQWQHCEQQATHTTSRRERLPPRVRDPHARNLDLTTAGLDGLGRHRREAVTHELQQFDRESTREQFGVDAAARPRGSEHFERPAIVRSEQTFSAVHHSVRFNWIELNPGTPPR